MTAPTLTEFLLARIAEDEAAARAATPGPWRWTGDYPSGTCVHGTDWVDHGPDLESATATDGAYGETWPASVITSSGYDASNLEIKDADADHIARHNPARALAECEAKRRIVEAHPTRIYTDDEPDFSVEISEHLCPRGPSGRAGLCYTLRALAVVYADHPDYRQEWKP